MSKSIHEIKKSLSQRDTEALKSLYDFRCLTQNQIYELHYNESLRTGQEVSDNTCKKKIRDFLSLGLIKKTDYLDSEVYFLTPFGIEFIRYCFDLPTNIYDSQKKVVKRGYYTAKELEVYPKYINHQINLNQFVIEFSRLNLEGNYKYYDEKYVSQYTGIRPDGMITMFDTDFFLEMDMSTESKRQLFEKWENYRNFINSREYSYKERKIVVLFIVEGALKDNDREDEQIKQKIANRVELIKYTIYERLLDKIDSDFDVYVGSKEQILKLLHAKIVPLLKSNYELNDKIKKVLETKHGFTLAHGEALKKTFHGTEYGLYIRKLTEQNNIVVENNRIQEFLFDEYSYSPASVLSKIAYLEKNNSYFRANFKRDICYIVLAESEKQIYDDIKIVDLIGVKNVFFTTIERLETFPFYEALFAFDFLGNIHRFTNSGLSERIFERNMRN
ncbi:MAG: hypothetical protein K0R54_56 [Clostridiaceae bacterium]|nr:hypothetical protein [Clostridiaceae bacterium]